MSPLHSQEAKAWSITTAVEESQKHLLRLASGTPHSQLSVVTFLGGHMCWWSPLVPQGTPVGYHYRGEARPVPLS